jgi:signal transduction histidine kinase
LQQKSLPDTAWAEAFDHIDFSNRREPLLLSPTDFTPLTGTAPTTGLRQLMVAAWMESAARLIAVPVVQGRELTGVILIEEPAGTSELREADIKFLAITASQLAITLQNLTLLEQTQRAYAELKELQDQTIELEKMATRGQMSAEIGHELNNFLGVVAGNLSLLDVKVHKGDYTDLDRHVAAMNETIEKIKTFTASLMDLRQISSKQERFSFSQLLRDVVEYLRPQKRFRGVTLDIKAPDEDIPFDGDITQTQQLLYNLFNNAADATEGCAAREITARLAADPAANTFSLTISDTGAGFDPSLLKKAFQEKFTTKETGHGFGLVVCKRIIDNHRGSLDIISEPGAGTTITITFPAASSPVPKRTAVPQATA